jgi:hypothetical protein
MKFGRVWNATVDRISDPRLRELSINYKQWKKLSANSKHRGEREYASLLMNILDVDLEKVERVFQEAVDSVFPDRKSKMGLISFRNKKEGGMGTDLKKNIYLFAMLQKKTLYKVTKRLDKKLDSNGAFKKWFREKVDLRKYGILGGFWMKRLSLEIGEAGEGEEACPVCLESLDKNAMPTIITHCGHVICGDCMEALYQVKGKRGTIRNILEHNRSSDYSAIRCPICRCPEPQRGFDEYHVFPSACSRLVFSKISH